MRADQEVSQSMVIRFFKVLYRSPILSIALVSLIAAVIYWAELPDPPIMASPSQKLIGQHIFFAQPAALAALLASVLALLTRRFIFSLAMVISIFLLLTLLSKVKYSYLKQKLLFTDFIYQLREASELSFFINNYFYLFVKGLLAVAACLAILALVFVFDKTRIRRSIAGVCVLLSLVAVEAAWRQVHDYYRDTVFAWASFSDQHLSNFIISTRMYGDHFNKSWSFGDAPAKPGGAEPVISTEIAAPAVRPNIIVILQESSVDPALFYDGPQYAVPRSFFQSGDGAVRRLNVKTWGGKTWISEHGFVLGADVSYFGPRKDFLGVLGSGKFRASFAQELKQAGYRSTLNYPSPTTFLNTRNFYLSLGFDKVYSEADMALEVEFGGPRPRDKDYYSFTLQDLERQQKIDKTQPNFYFVLTSATHHPWDYMEFPGVRENEYIPNDPVAEFARRQRIAADDLDWFKAEIAKRFPGQPFLIAGFGDHHPMWTHDFVFGFPSWKGRKGITETMWRTYYFVDGVNFQPDYSVLSSEIEIGFLGESILSSAKLPLSSSYQVRQWLREKCAGKWADCSDKQSLDTANGLLSHGQFSIFNPR